MKILVAEDDLVTQRRLENTLTKWGYQVVVTSDGLSAWEVLQGPEAPRMAVLDWLMPGLDGVDICRRLRENPTTATTYVLLLTGQTSKDSVVTGLDSGADDYLTKPFDREELRARLQVGRRIVELQATLAGRVQELEAALAQVKQLQDLLPICSYCKKIRDDQNYWQQLETYLSNHADIRFSHGICPSCMDAIVRPQLAELNAARHPR